MDRLTVTNEAVGTITTGVTKYDLDYPWVISGAIQAKIGPLAVPGSVDPFVWGQEVNQLYPGVLALAGTNFRFLLLVGTGTNGVDQIELESAFVESHLGLALKADYQRWMADPTAGQLPTTLRSFELNLNGPVTFADAAGQIDFRTYGFSPLKLKIRSNEEVGIQFNENSNTNATLPAGAETEFSDWAQIFKLAFSVAGGISAKITVIAAGE